MRNFLMTTAAAGALACAGFMVAGPASAADKLSVGVGGYMEQWIGVSDLDSAAGNGGVSQYNDSEIFFRGKLEADNGLTFSVKVEFEGFTHPDVVDESQVTVGGSFGQIVLGSEDDPATLMHYTVQDVGVGLACGDPSFIDGLTSCARSGGKGLGTAGHLIGGDSQKIAYYTPRINGLQFGVSYSPESVEDLGPGGAPYAKAPGSPVNNDEDAVSLGLNYQGEMGEASVSLSIGHYQKSQVMEPTGLMSGSNPANSMTRGAVTADTATIAAYEAGRDLMAVAPATTVAQGDAAAAVAATNRLAAATDVMASRADDQALTNFGIRVGMGAFGFSAAYATHDGGKYMVANSDIPVYGGPDWDHDGDATTAAVPDDQTNNDPSNDTARTVLVKNTAADYEVASAGVMYSEGPMAVSLAYMVADADDGSSVNATMLSLSYALAPGIASKSTLMSGEQDGVSGNAFVTGITLSF